MKLLTRPRLIVLAVLTALVGGGVWLDRSEAAVRNGEVVIDEAFLHRLQTDDEKTTRDPAIKGLLRMEHGRKNLPDDLKMGTVGVAIRWFHEDSVVVKVTEPTQDGRRVYSVRLMKFSRHRRTTWEWWSPKWWNEEILHRSYWNQ